VNGSATASRSPSRSVSWVERWPPGRSRSPSRTRAARPRPGRTPPIPDRGRHTSRTCESADRVARGERAAQP
jgi:hypothetical protein